MMLAAPFLLLATLLLLHGGAASAQNFGNIKPHTFLGNPDPTASKPAVPVPLQTLTPAVTPQMFGAKCDGTFDDTDAIQAAITASNRVQLDQNCVTTRTITLHPGVVLEGNGKTRSAPFTLTCKTTTTDCFYAPWPSNGIVLRDMSISGLAQTAGNILNFQKSSDLTLDNIMVANGFNLANFTAGNNVVLNNVFFQTARGQYALKWDYDGADGGTGDILTISNSTINCGYNATPANTADGILWDGATHTLNISNVAILSCNHGLWMKNSRGLVANKFPLYLAANNLQIEGAATNAFRADAGAFLWIANSIFFNSRGAPGQGSADGNVFVLTCDAVAGANCGSTPAGGSLQAVISNTVFNSNSNGACVSIDWQLTTITSSTVTNCSGGSLHAAPGILYGAHANGALLSDSTISDKTTSYAVQTTAGSLSAGAARLKNNNLDGFTGPVLDTPGYTDGVGLTTSVIIQVPAGNTTASATVPLKQIRSVSCSPAGGTAGGVFYTTQAAGPPPSVSIVQTTTTIASYGCIVTGY
jgi:hypothetical protein